MRKIFHDEGLQTQFTQGGYVQIPMLAPDEITHILQQLGTLKPDDNFAPEGHDGFNHTFHCSFLDRNVEYKRRAFDLIKSSFGDRIARYLNGYRILSCNFYVKPPGTGTFVVHQNWPTIANLNDTTVTVWCPLQDVIETNGALQFVPGSHKIMPFVEGPICPGYFDGFRQTLIDQYLKPNTMSAGEAMIFDDGLIHWSANNDSDKPRIAIQIACVPADAQPVFFFLNPQKPAQLELIASDEEFYLTTDIVDLTRRQPHWTSLGFVQNPNRYIDEAEFADLLARGPQTRAEIYATEVNPLLPIDPKVPPAGEPATVASEIVPASFWADVRAGFRAGLRTSLPKLFGSKPQH